MAQPSSSRQSPITQSLIATGGTALGYLATVVQLLLYARVLGVGAEADALGATIAWALAVTGLVGTTLVSVVVPAYTRDRLEDEARAGRVLFAASIAAIAVVGLASILTAVFAPDLALALLPGGDSSSQALLVDLLRLAAPLLPLWVAVIAATALANARRRYLTASASTAVPSLFVIAALVMVGTAQGVMVGYTLGFAAQLVVLVADRSLAGMSAVPIDRDRLRAIAIAAVPVAAGFAFINATSLIARAAASTGGTGDLAAFDYAARLTLAIEGLLLTGALAVALTTWSERAARPTGNGRSVGRAITVAGLLGAITAAMLAVLAEPVVALLFEGGDFTTADTELVAGVLRWMAVAMAGRMVAMVGMRAILAAAQWRSVSALGLTAMVLVGLGSWLPVGRGVDVVTAGYSLGWVAVAGITTALALRASRKQ